MKTYVARIGGKAVLAFRAEDDDEARAVRCVCRRSPAPAPRRHRKAGRWRRCCNFGSRHQARPRLVGAGAKEIRRGWLWFGATLVLSAPGACSCQNDERDYNAHDPVYDWGLYAENPGAKKEWLHARPISGKGTVAEIAEQVCIAIKSQGAKVR
jgi:hypothetical protein